jgi:multidrug transporter EmrE-like cation transporter
MKYLLLLSSIALAITGQLILKRGVMQSSLVFTLPSILSTLFSPLIILGLSFYVMSTLCWLFVLQRFPLSVAYPTGALGYVFTVLLSVVFLQEPLSVRKIVSLLLIVSGVATLYQ